jgi:hypothetical protein
VQLLLLLLLLLLLPPLLLLVLLMLRLHATGPEEAVQYVKQSGIKLCALGADGQVLRDAGLQVRCLSRFTTNPCQNKSRLTVGCLRWYRSQCSHAGRSSSAASVNIGRSRRYQHVTSCLNQPSCCCCCCRCMCLLQRPAPRASQLSWPHQARRQEHTYCAQCPM